MHDTRLATTAEELTEAAQLLVAFNTEYGDPTPPAAELAAHLGRLVAYLAELYVVPQLRGQGIGSVFLRDVLDHARARGATYVELTTTEDDEADCRLYERFGFDCHEGRGDGPVSLYYERTL